MTFNDPNPLPDCLRGQSILTLTREQLEAEDAERSHRAGKTVLIYDGMTGESRYVPSAGSIPAPRRPSTRK